MTFFSVTETNSRQPQTIFTLQSAAHDDDGDDHAATNPLETNQPDSPSLSRIMTRLDDREKRRKQSQDSTAKQLKQHNRMVLHREERVNLVFGLTLTLRSIFLPAGYPHSVSPDYRAYQIYDTLQAFCSSLIGLLSTRAILQGFGVGDKESSVMSATLAWTLRDGVSMLTRIIFGWQSGNSFQPDVKTWRFTADILNNLGFFLDFFAVTIAAKPYFPYIASVAMVFKTCCWTAGGCTKAVLTSHFARWGNAADLDAKDGSQETLVNLVGMIVGSFLIRLLPPACSSDDLGVSPSPSPTPTPPPLTSTQPSCISKTKFSTHLWISFFTLAALHLWCNYKAVSAVILHTINRQRAKLLLAHFLEHSSVLCPTQIAQQESILSPLLLDDGVRIGESLSSLDMQEKTAVLSEISKNADDSPNDESTNLTNHRIVIHRSHDRNDHLDSNSTIIKVFLEEGCPPSVILEAYFAALLIQLNVCKTQREALNFLSSRAFCKRLEEQGWRLTCNDIYVQPYAFKLGRYGDKKIQ